MTSNESSQAQSRFNLSRWLTATEKTLDLIAGWIVLLMMVVVVAQIVFRYAAQALPVVYEVVQLMLVAITYLGLSYAQSQRRHIRIEALIQVIPPKWRKVLEVVVLLLAFMTFAVMTYITGQRAYEAWRMHDTSTGLIPFPLWPSKALVPIGTALLCLRFIEQLIRSFMGSKSQIGMSQKASVEEELKQVRGLD